MAKIAFISTALPRQCGIALFTNDLINNLMLESSGDAYVTIAIERDNTTRFSPSQNGRYVIIRDELATYRGAAEYLILNNIEAVSLQHEYGLFGGPAGSYVLETLRNTNIPVITTLHTVLRNPNKTQRHVLIEIAELSRRIIVISPSAKTILKEVYGISGEAILCIPHGIPDLPILNQNSRKVNWGVKDNIIIVSHGFLSPNKGIEYTINAIAEVRKLHENVTYVVAGITHPELFEREGELYRNKLEELSSNLKLRDAVVFVNEFLDENRLRELVNLADIYVNANTEVEQISSGTLAYAVGCGKPIITTRNRFAVDYLSDAAILISPKSSEAIADNIIHLLNDAHKRDMLAQRVYEIGRRMLWQEVASKYRKCFNEIIISSNPSFDSAASRGILRSYNRVNQNHFCRMTDDVGIIQHANHTLPNLKEGYCTDDNARALIVAVLLEDVFNSDMSNAIYKYLSFLSHAYNPETLRMRNFFSYDRRWTEAIGSECCHGRTLWALGILISKTTDLGVRAYAIELFNLLLQSLDTFNEPKSIAYCLLGICEYQKWLNGDYLFDTISRLSETLLGFYKKHSSSDWPWFEDHLTFFNGVLPYSLLLSEGILKHQTLLDIALRSLGWLDDIQCSNQNHFAPIGNDGFFHRSGNRAYFDQQPVEAKSMTLALLEAYRVTGDIRWLMGAHRAFSWFFGQNDMSLPLYDSYSGGCRDGLTSNGINENQGAESTLSYLISRISIERYRHEMENTAYGI